MSHWKQWAQRALDKMNEPGWEIREQDKDWRGGAEGARDALRQVVQQGHEPYYTLKAFVCLNKLDKS